MGMQFRVLYRDPRPVPASEWTPVEHGDTALMSAPVLAIQFRDPSTPIDENNPAYVLTLAFNGAVDLMTDENGYYVERSNAEVADLLGMPESEVAEILGDKR